MSCDPPRRRGASFTLNVWTTDAPARTRAVLLIAGALGVLAAAAAALLDYTLAYNDARARLVVARRVFDSLTPGFDQLGGIWLPLPHLLQVPLVQSDVLYHTGLGMVAINVAAFVGLAVATQHIVTRITGTPWAGVAAVALVVSHPDLLYLQATPMTEMLTLGLIAGATALLLSASPERWRAWAAGVLLALAMLTRYEAWLAAGTIVAVTAWGTPRQPGGARGWDRRVVPLAAMCLAALGCAAAWSKAMTGSWIVAGGFFPQTEVLGRPLFAVAEVARVTVQAAGPGLLILAAAGASWAIAQARCAPAGRLGLLAAAPMSALLLYASMAYAGHPMLNRFAVFLLVPAIWFAMAGVLALRDAGWMRLRTALVAAVVVWQAGVWVWPPVVREAAADMRQRDAFRVVVDALEPVNSDERLLASMWTAAAILHELSTRGLPLRRVVHEGNGEHWRLALATPADHVSWVLVTCLPGDGDRVAHGLKSSSDFTAAFELAAKTTELELYRRQRTGGLRGSPEFCGDPPPTRRLDEFATPAQ